MNINDFKSTLPVLLKHNIVPFVWGYQGIGKTQSVKQYAEANSLGFVHLHLATQADPGDIIGLLKHNPDGTVSHARPQWFPTEGKGIIFLDELNRAHPDIIQAMFSFITSRTIHTHTLPPGWTIVAAGNYQNDSFNVTDTSDAAWMSRFCHLHFTPTVEEFILFTESQGNVVVADFIREHPEMLETKNKTVDIPITPDRRAWNDMIAPLERESLKDTLRYEVYKGLVGDVAASAFMTSRKQELKRLRLRDIFENYAGVRERVLSLATKKSTRFDVLSQPIKEFEARVANDANAYTFDQLTAFKTFLADCPSELVNQFVKTLAQMRYNKRDFILNDSEFVRRVVA